MTRTEFENRFRTVLNKEGLETPAYAVVVPVVWSGDGAELILEVRAEGIPQAGDPCFPGGRIEAGETPAQAAAREMEEELAIKADPGLFLGRLPMVQTIHGRQTDVFVCTVSPDEADGIRRNPAEVSEVLRVPVPLFLKDPYAPSYPFGGHDIWGMTAGAIRHFCAAWERAGISNSCADGE